MFPESFYQLKIGRKQQNKSVEGYYDVIEQNPNY